MGRVIHEGIELNQPGEEIGNGQMARRLEDFDQ